MIELSEKQIGEYHHRNYTAVDGLWFMKVEEKYGFDAALDVDNEVWKVLPKIQARMLKSFGNVGDGIDALRECLETKLRLEGFEFHTKTGKNGGFSVIIDGCPWHNTMVKVGREKYSSLVGNRICRTEYTTFAYEFDSRIQFEMETQICCRARQCILNFFM
ncbi:L-2-amino-thiazoline-4-carboxylic acid hydrolase [bacterium]|nr:L-2-amino-thiazoline-4-carboxylic acid hydrolase [bacterium]